MSEFRDFVEALKKTGVDSIEFSWEGVSFECDEPLGCFWVSCGGDFESVWVTEFESWLCEKLKPEWEGVPEDIDWIACDLNGTWWGYYSRPLVADAKDFFGADGEVLVRTGIDNEKWRDSLEGRPESVAEGSADMGIVDRLWEDVKDAVDGVRCACEGKAEGRMGRVAAAMAVCDKKLNKALAESVDE